MKEILEVLEKEDTIKFQKKLENKKVNALEAYFDEDDGKTTVIIYKCKHKKIRTFCFNEKNYFERLNYYQAISDSLIADCGVNINRGRSLDRVMYFNPKQSKKIRSVIIWYTGQKRG